MRLNTEHITESSRFWNEVNTLAKETFPPKEYLAPERLVEMAKEENFDFLPCDKNRDRYERLSQRQSVHIQLNWQKLEDKFNGNS